MFRRGTLSEKTEVLTEETGKAQEDTTDRRDKLVAIGLLGGIAISLAWFYGPIVACAIMGWSSGWKVLLIGDGSYVLTATVIFAKEIASAIRTIAKAAARAIAQWFTANVLPHAVQLIIDMYTYPVVIRTAPDTLANPDASQAPERPIVNDSTEETATRLIPHPQTTAA